MTTSHQSAHEAANRLKDALFRLYDRADQPDVVWTEDGPQWGDTHHDADSPTLVSAIAAAEERLTAVLVRYRDQLGTDPRWISFYTSLDNPEPVAEHDAHQAAEAEHGYRVEVSHPATVHHGRLLADTYQWAHDHLTAGHLDLPPSGRILLEIYDRDADSPLLGGYDTPERLAEQVRQQALEHAAAQTLLRAHSEVQGRRSAPAVPLDSAPTTGTINRARELLDAKPIEALVARWAIAEVRCDTGPAQNPWAAPMQAAGLDPQIIRILAKYMDTSELTASPLYPVVRQRASELSEFLAYYADAARAANDPSVSAQVHATEQDIRASTVRRLIDAANPSGAASTDRGRADTQRVGEPSVPEGLSAVARTARPGWTRR